MFIDFYLFPSVFNNIFLLGAEFDFISISKLKVLFKIFFIFEELHFLVCEMNRGLSFQNIGGLIKVTAFSKLLFLSITFAVLGLV